MITETRVRLNLADGRRTAAGAHDLEAPLHRPDDLRDVEDREAAREPILQRLDEELLARDAVEIRVGVAVAHEVERLLAVELLVAGLEVDRREAARPALCIEVAAIDVGVDAAELVHEELEAVEVDGDQVVDGEAGQLLDRVECSARPADRPRGVDAIRRRRRRRIAVDGNDEVTREREQRQRLQLRVGPHEHDRVGARRSRVEPLRAGARVVSDDERGRRERRRRHSLQVLLGDDELFRLRRERVERLVAVQIKAARETRRDDEEHEQDPAEHARREPATRTRRRRRLLVAPHLLERARRKNGAPIAVDGRSTTDSSLERRPHLKKRRP